MGTGTKPDLREVKIEPLTRADKIEPVVQPITGSFTGTTKIPETMWQKLAMVGGRQNGKSIFTKAVFDEMHKLQENEKEKEKMAEKWIWVEGYKGTDKNMCCRGFQFELNKMYGAEQGSDVKTCESGFHFCLKLNGVFGYYPVNNGNRFFKVRALVREKDYLECTTTKYCYGLFTGPDKLTSMSIEFISELTPDEILKNYCSNDIDTSDWSDEDKIEALNISPEKLMHKRDVKELVDLGYSEPFADFVVTKSAGDVAKSVATQPVLSMDMKALFILKDIYD